MKPLRVYNIICRKYYPKLGEKLIFNDEEDKKDYKLANWGSNFKREFDDIKIVLEIFKPIDEEHYPHALVITNQKLIIKAIIPIIQHSNMEK